MKHYPLLVGLFAVLVVAFPLNTNQVDANENTSPVNYGDYGAYGSYGAYQDLTPAQAPAPALSVNPTASTQNFVAITTRSGDISLHLQPISASGQHFYIGKSTSTYCPLTDCNGFINFTAFTARPNDPTTGLSLLTAVPGGQSVYVAPDGQLGYTPAHSGSTPPGSVLTPFTYTPGASQGSVGSLTFRSGGWVACPVQGGNGVYQIYAQAASSFSRQDCTPVGFTTAAYQGNPAWQYN